MSKEKGKPSSANSQIGVAFQNYITHEIKAHGCGHLSRTTHAR